ncbi:MAG: 4Fe-4S dicluster domain-containing protein [Chloroflexota bacterium]
MSASITNVDPVGVLVDVTRCTGCGECIQACVQANHLQELSFPERYLSQKSAASPDGLSAERWTSILKVGANGVSSDDSQAHFVRKFCRHCLEPACVSVCPVGAMYKTPEGPVVYDAKKCMGCRYCMMACPFGIPRYEWDSAAPLVRKCTLCVERLRQGQLPACVEACPNQVLTFGKRNDLLLAAHETIQSAPDTYLQQVYGETEAGGTAVLYISDIPLDFLRIPLRSELNQAGALPDLSWNWLDKVPALSVATAGLMTGLFWVLGRRMQVAEARLRAQQTSPDKEA